MRCFISTLGTPGDIIPLGRLAGALAGRGHTVTAHSWPLYARWFPSGVAFVPTDADVSADAIDDMLRDALRMETPWDQIREFGRLLYGLGAGAGPASRYFARCREAMTGQDLVICNVFDHLAQAAADAAGVPWASWAARPPPVDPAVDRLMAPTDRALSQLVTEVIGARATVKTFRARSRVLELIDASPALVMPHGSEPTLQVTGTWLAHATPDDVLPDEVAAFVDASGTLLVTFGPYPDLGGRSEALIQAAKRTGWRVLLHLLPPAPAPDVAADDVLVFRGRLPFAALLPRVAAVVHHGGGGTTHEVCRAARPSFAIPHAGDQYYWSRAIPHHHLGPSPLPYTRLVPRELDRRLLALRTGPYARALGPMAATLRAEDGLAVAVQRVEAVAIG